MPTRRAQLIAQTVTVCCPACGDAQPNPDDGSHIWTHDQVVEADGRRQCVACDEPLLLFAARTVHFQ